MKKLLLLAIVILMVCNVNAQQDQANQTTTYYFIRHAEKDRSYATNKNPDLIKKGKRRARKWKRYFKNKNLDAIYSTNYKRTLSTAFPTSKNKQLPVILYNPRQTDFETFKTQTKGKSVLIVGHSNTTPSFVNAIINQKKYQDIEDTVNYKLFIVTISNDKITDQVIDLN